ncbi:hypothetical protein CBER1_11828 [Cercospora berteroae]|uniref:Uncharacterized protein n=1 Tax=Cercospora berteroae TaxID=357750 RepID=A0A2S6BZJ1_9PEZI|nr:hypothetical protein CBER1_11828 [Cercospora berteroae]
MLSAVPFRADGILYIILFGLKQPTQINLDSTNSLQCVVFIHLSDLSPDQISSVAINDVAHIGLGPVHGFVRATPRGPRPLYLTTNHTANYLFTIAGAVSSHMVLRQHEETNFLINLSQALHELIRYVGWSDQDGGTHCLLDSESSSYGGDFRLSPRLHSKRQTYSKFILLLEIAASKRRNHLQLVSEVSQVEHCPIHCFVKPEDIVPWLQDWMRDGERAIIEPGRAPGIRRTVLRTQNNQPVETDFGGKDLASKKRKLEWDYVSTSFYNMGDDIEDAKVSEESGLS